MEAQKEKTEVRISRKSGVVGLILLICIQLCLYIVLFVFGKTAHHEDEFFSYGMANSFDRPFLYGSGYSVYDNYNTWMKGSDFYNYITVQESQAFRYDMVWRNQTVDTHPPLYYILIHTISSCFPERFSWWWAFGINLCAFVISQIFIYRLVGRLTGRVESAWLVCGLWGFSIAGQNTHLFLRMYALQTMFCIMLIWYMSQVVMNRKRRNLPNAVLMILVTVGGALTQHLFLVFAFFCTLFICLYQLLKKQWRTAVFIGLTMAMGVMLSILIFPATLKHLFSDTGVIWHGEAGIFENLRFILILSLGELTGILVHMHTGQSDLEIIYVLLAFLVPAAILYLCYVKKEKKISDEMFILVVLYYTLLCYLLVIANRIYYGEFGMETDRYVFCLLPLICVIALPLLLNIFEMGTKKLLKKEKTGFYIVVLLGTISIALQNQNPVFRNYLQESNPVNGSVEAYVTGQDCLFMCSPILQPCFCLMLAQAEDIYTALPYDEDYQTDVKAEDLEFLMKNGHFFLLVDTEWKNDEGLQKMLRYFAMKTGMSVYYRTEETTHGVRVGLYEFCQ